MDSKFHKIHYKMIADSFYDIAVDLTNEQRDSYLTFAHEIAYMFKQDNPKFNSRKFLSIIFGFIPKKD